MFLNVPLSGQVRYTITAIANPGPGKYSSANAINDQGQIAGTDGYNAAAYQGCYFLSGGLVKVLYPAGEIHQSCEIGDINNSAEIVGGLSVIILGGTSVTEGWVYNAGTLTILPPVNGFYPSARAVNNFGDIVGTIGALGSCKARESSSFCSTKLTG
jgi:uncharacterized membrane protein